MEDRRRAPRQAAVWMGTCCVEGDDAEAWRDCGVFDFSTLGVGMDFRHHDLSDLVGRRITMRLPVGGSMDITLLARCATFGSVYDVVRAGIEFLGLSEDELYIVDLLELGFVDHSGDRSPEAQASPSWCGAPCRSDRAQTAWTCHSGSSRDHRPSARQVQEIPRPAAGGRPQRLSASHAARWVHPAPGGGQVHPRSRRTRCCSSSRCLRADEEAVAGGPHLAEVGAGGPPEPDPGRAACRGAPRRRGWTVLEP